MKTLLPFRHKAMLLAVIFLSAVLGASAQYSVYSTAGDVQIKRAGKLIPAQTEMKITTADRIVVGSNSNVQILNARDSRLYKCDTPGEHTISGIMLDADKESNSSTLHRRMRMSKGDVQEGTMYVEKGKVTRALDTFDPAAVNVRIDPASLARYIASTMRAGQTGKGFPAQIICADNDSILSFEVINTMPEPLYMNVITYSDTDKGDFQVSTLGQPVGSYVILPHQSLSRAQYWPTQKGHKHIVIATDYYFSIDELIEHLGELSKEEQGSPVISSSMPVYIQMISEKTNQ